MIAFNIPRQLQRTLLSLAPGYQRHLAASEYEVIVIDNGSKTPVEISDEAQNVRVIRVDAPTVSPAAAINLGLREARGEVIAVMIDGARLASPGLLHFGNHAVSLYSQAVVASLGWYVGFDYDRFARFAGFDADAEDALLASVGWTVDGYRLFEISTLDDSSVDGWFPPISESNCLFLSRSSWQALNGVDERFLSPGGGLLNLDTFRRALELPESELVILLGEGTFHQQHGGVATGLASEDFAAKWDLWATEYESIRGKEYTMPMPRSAPTYVGTLPAAVLERFTHSVMRPALHRQPPLGDTFDALRWTARPLLPAEDPVTEALIDLMLQKIAEGQFTAAVAVARMARERAPHELEPQRVASLLASWIPFGQPTQEHIVEFHIALGQANSIMGATSQARAHFEEALAHNHDLQVAHVGLSRLLLPGDGYLIWLQRIYEFLCPEFVLEIGISNGLSLATVRPPTIAIGVDPAPSALIALQAQSHIFPETSDAFFEARRLDRILDGKPLGAAFIDGLHLFEQSLRDFVNVERHCGPGSVVMLRHTIAINEATQNRICDTEFHSGDVWKTVLAIRKYRPELDVFTIATPLTGLTLIAGFNPNSPGLGANYDRAVAEFIDLPFAEFIESSVGASLNIIENRWELVLPRLERLRAGS